jgi:hypothetical protein
VFGVVLLEESPLLLFVDVEVVGLSSSLSSSSNLAISVWKLKICRLVVMDVCYDCIVLH